MHTTSTRHFLNIKPALIGDKQSYLWHFNILDKFCAAFSLCNSLQPPWTIAHQAPLSMGFFRQEYWSGLSFPSPRDLPNIGIKPTAPVSLALQADSLPAEPWGTPLLHISLSLKSSPFSRRMGSERGRIVLGRF